MSATEWVVAVVSLVGLRSRSDLLFCVAFGSVCVRRLLTYFRTWRLERMYASSHQHPLPPFNPPKAKIKDGLADLLDFMRHTRSEEFKAGVRRAFVTTGLVRDPETWEFRLYSTRPNAIPPHLRNKSYGDGGTVPDFWNDPSYLDAVALISGYDFESRAGADVDADEVAACASSGAASGGATGGGGGTSASV